MLSPLHRRRNKWLSTFKQSQAHAKKRNHPFEHVECSGGSNIIVITSRKITCLRFCNWREDPRFRELSGNSEIHSNWSNRRTSWCWLGLGSLTNGDALVWLWMCGSLRWDESARREPMSTDSTIPMETCEISRTLRLSSTSSAVSEIRTSIPPSVLEVVWTPVARVVPLCWRIWCCSTRGFRCGHCWCIPLQQLLLQHLAGLGRPLSVTCWLLDGVGHEVCTSSIDSFSHHRLETMNCSVKSLNVLSWQLWRCES